MGDSVIGLFLVRAEAGPGDRNTLAFRTDRRGCRLEAPIRAAVSCEPEQSLGQRRCKDLLAAFASRCGVTPGNGWCIEADRFLGSRQARGVAAEAFAVAAMWPSARGGGSMRRLVRAARRRRLRAVTGQGPAHPLWRRACARHGGGGAVCGGPAAGGGRSAPDPRLRPGNRQARQDRRAGCRKGRSPILPTRSIRRPGRAPTHRPRALGLVARAAPRSSR